MVRSSNYTSSWCAAAVLVLLLLAAAIFVLIGVANFATINQFGRAPPQLLQSGGDEA